MKKICILLGSAAVIAGVPMYAMADAQPIQLAQMQTQQSLATGPTMSETELGELIGKDVENAAGENIGEIDSVYIGRDGKVKSVIVGVGGFLGVGEHDVALGWNNLQIPATGEKVVVNVSKDQLKAMPEYEYVNPTQRGTVFRDPS